MIPRVNEMSRIDMVQVPLSIEMDTDILHAKNTRCI